MLLEALDIRISHDADYREMKAARMTVRFLKSQAAAEVGPGDKELLVKTIWKLYWRLHKSDVLAASDATRQILREQFPIWSQVAVIPKWVAA